MSETMVLQMSERLHRALALANEDAARRCHEYLGTEHLLVGITSTGEGVVEVVLGNLGLSSTAIRHRIDEAVKKGAQTAALEKRPRTTRCQRALALAESEARSLGHPYLGTEHVLMGLLVEGQSIGCMILFEAGITEAAARDEILRVLGPMRPASNPNTV